MSSNLEINFRRLLSRCEKLAEDQNNINWRFEKYVGSLETYLSDLKNANKTITRPSKDLLSEYTKKVNFLKGVIEAEKLKSSPEKIVAIEKLLPVTTSSSQIASREVQLKTRVRYEKGLREELLGTKKDGNADAQQLRLRSSASGVSGGSASVDDDISTVLRHHHKMQEKVAEEMIHLAKNIKENAISAGRIIQEDTKKIEDTSKSVDTNYGKLKIESERLEGHVQKGCNWWVWIMLVIVALTFVWTVIFMKLFPKPR